MVTTLHPDFARHLENFQRLTAARLEEFTRALDAATREASARSEQGKDRGRGAPGSPAHNSVVMDSLSETQTVVSQRSETLSRPVPSRKRYPRGPVRSVLTESTL